MSKKTVDGIQGLLFIVVVWQGVIPLLARGLGDKRPSLSLAAHLPSPAWWIAAWAVCAIGALAIVVVDRLAVDD